MSMSNYNLLLTKSEGCIGEYWPKGVAVWTECSEVCTKVTKGQHSPAQSQESEVSCLLYGIVSDISLLQRVNVCNIHLPSAKFEQ